MSLFDRFKNTKEHGFREDFIRPLLIRMGYVGISSKHGVQEFGKDYVFSELDRFGQFRHMIVQAKHAKALNQGKKVDEIITQIRQCFHVPYTLPNAPTEHHYVSAVYVFNTGLITPNAEHQIRHALPREFASNTHFYGGPQLETLETAIIREHDRNIVERLMALYDQLAMNVNHWAEQCAMIEEKNDVSIKPPLLHGLEDYMNLPALPSRVFPEQCYTIWMRAKVIHTMTLRLYQTRVAAKTLREDLAHIAELCKGNMKGAEQVMGFIQEAIESMPARVID